MENKQHVKSSRHVFACFGRAAWGMVTFVILNASAVCQ